MRGSICSSRSSTWGSNVLSLMKSSGIYQSSSRTATKTMKKLWERSPYSKMRSGEWVPKKRDRLRRGHRWKETVLSMSLQKTDHLYVFISRQKYHQSSQRQRWISEY
jgi:hypothetical protein